MHVRMNKERTWLLIALIIALIIGGIYMAGKASSETTPKVTYAIKQYTGIGSGVLKHGTLLDLTGKEQYTEPADIVVHIDAPGTWYMARTEND